MGKKPSRRKRPAEPDQKLATLTAAELAVQRFFTRGTIEYSIAHAEEIAAADRERKLRERAHDELRLVAIKKELEGKPKEPGARAGQKLTPAVVQRHVDKYGSDLKALSPGARVKLFKADEVGMTVSRWAIRTALKKFNSTK